MRDLVPPPALASAAATHPVVAGTPVVGRPADLCGDPASGFGDGAEDAIGAAGMRKTRISSGTGAFGDALEIPVIKATDETHPGQAVVLAPVMSNTFRLFETVRGLVFSIGIVFTDTPRAFADRVRVEA
ncbi:MAG: hypothetical protein AAF913_11120 [Pseudomonadota bacterium]